MSLYDVLGVKSTARTDEIRRAYLDLARAHHPDLAGGGDPARMAEVNAAWAVLGDPSRRRSYDDAMVSEPEPAVRSRPEPPPWKPYDSGPDPEPMPAEDAVAATPARRALTMAPAVFFMVAVPALAVGLVVGLTAVLMLGVVCLIAAGASFVLAPVVTMFESLRDDPDRS